MISILDVRPVGVARYRTLPESHRDYHASFHVDLSDGSTVSLEIGVSARHGKRLVDGDAQRAVVHAAARDVAEVALAAGTLVDGAHLELSDEQVGRALGLVSGRFGGAGVDSV